MHESKSNRLIGKVTNLIPTRSRAGMNPLEPTHVLENNSIAALPVIGNEVNLERKPRQYSKVELSRKDMQNFLVNGSISKEFIESNKKELQKFIKTCTRSDQGGFFKGYHEIAARTDVEGVDDKQRYSSIDQSFEQKKNSKIFAATIHHSNSKQQTLTPNEKKEDPFLKRKVGHQMPEHPFRGETSTVNNKIIETWINETLADAQHLDIPGVILKPAYKLPIARYGIDRYTMTNAGVANEEVDRVYRCLFVYSVGFYEMLKAVLAQTEQNFQTITSLWLVFQILLEYCCQTDYKIMMGEISRKYQESLEKLTQDNLEKIHEYIENEKTLKQNIETMQDYQDQLEKEKQQEKQLRLRLEEEYMQNTKMHEEEVKLRLKFEAKLNILYGDHRQLQITHDRGVSDLKIARAEIQKLEATILAKTEEIVSEQRRSTDLEFKLRAMVDNKEFTDKDLKLKVQRIKALERDNGAVQEVNQFAEYNLQDYRKEVENYRKQNDLLRAENSLVQSQLERQNILEKEARDKVMKFETLYNELLQKFETITKEHDIIRQHKEALAVVVQEQQTNLDELRESDRALRAERLDLQTTNTQLAYDCQRALRLHDEIQLTATNTAQQLQQMNEHRHTTVDALQVKVRELIDTKQELYNAKETIEKRNATIKDMAQQIEFFKNEVSKAKMTIAENEKSHADAQLMLSRQLQDMSNMYDSSQKELRNWIQKYDSQTDSFNRASDVILDMKKDIKRLNDDKEYLDAQLEAAQEKGIDLQHKLEAQIDETVLAKKAQHEAMAMQMTLEEQIKAQNAAMVEQRADYEASVREIQITSEMETERNTMKMEDFRTFLVQRRELYERTQIENANLVKMKARKEELERRIVEVTVQIAKDETDRNELKTKLETIIAESAATKLQLETQLMMLQQESNNRVNELEQKITSDSINAIQTQKKLMEDVKNLNHQLTEAKVKISYQARSTSKGKQSEGTNDRKNKGTQTVTSNQPKFSDKHSQEQSQNNSMHSYGLISPKTNSTKQGDIRGFKKKAKRDDQRERSVDRESTMDQRLYAEPLNLEDQSFYTEAVQKQSRIGARTRQRSRANPPGLDAPLRKSTDTNAKVKPGDKTTSSFGTRESKNKQNVAKQHDEDEGRQGDQSENDQYDGELESYDEQIDEEVDEPDQDEVVEEEVALKSSERRAKQQQELYESFKKWVLQSELSMLRKVQFMVLTGIDVTKEVMDNLRAQLTIPMELRQVRLNMQQQNALARETEVQKEQFQSQLTESIKSSSPEANQSFKELLEDKKLEAEVLEFKKSFILKRLPDQIQIDRAKISLEYHQSKDANEPINKTSVSIFEQASGNFNDISSEPEKHPATINEVTTPANLNNKEELANKFQNLYSNFGKNNKQLILRLLEEQKNRMAFRAKQLADKPQSFEPYMESIKVGRHLIAKQRMKPNERIKHQLAFVAELKKQHELLATKDLLEELDARRLEEERLANQIVNEEKRLARMQRIVIIREDQIKEPPKPDVETRRTVVQNQTPDTVELERDKLELEKAFETFAQFPDEAFVSGEPDLNTRQNVELNMDDMIGIDAEVMIDEGIVTEGFKTELKEVPEEDDRLKEMHAGGVARVNRVYQRESSNERKESKKNIRGLLKAVESRRV